ncbi:MAG: hypothetical protein WCD44_00450, partial [Candidatus Babeliales bacterium]
MKKKKTILSFILLHFFLLNSKIQTKYKKAVVTVPVADLVGEEIGQLVNPQQVEQTYKQLPFAPGIKPEMACPRIQQLLFNEVVEIIKEKDQEVYIRIPHLFYLRSTKNKTPQTNYWTLKKNITTFDKIKEYKRDLTKIPLPISFKNNNKELNSKNTATLIEPWFDQKTKQIFSAGTRFTWAVQKKRKAIVYVFNPSKMQYEMMAIPNKKLAIQTQSQIPQEQRKNFIKLLRQWACKNEEYIP